MEKRLTIEYREYDSVEFLSEEDQELMGEAIAATRTAWAPYSHFCVGAALRLGDGRMVRGSNQENVAYPSGLCAERAALFAAGVMAGEQAVEALAIVARNPEGELTEASPCGACRQVMAETQQRSGIRLRVLMYLKGGRVREVEGVENLLPFGFEM